MSTRAFKLRFRRRLRLRKLQVEEFGQEAERQLERNFFKRLERLVEVRRFVITWFAFLILVSGCVVAQIRSLGAFYKVAQPISGGTYSEGILGSFTNANPLYATSPVDITASKLLFASLFTYNEKNDLVGDIAESIQVDDKNTTYTVKLKSGITWHDGQPLTAEDVVFTYSVIQNPDAKSPFRSSWQGIAVKAVDPLTVSFTLPNQLSAFPYSLVNGIVPKHILGGKSMQSLRSLSFNTTQPIGAGPFKFNALEVTGRNAATRQEHIAFDPFDKYHFGKPKLDRFVVHAFRSEELLLESYQAHEINAMVGLTKVPAEVEQSRSSHVYSLPLTASVMTFFRTTSPILGDVKIRQALVRATDRSAIIKDLQYPSQPIDSPFLSNQVGYNADLKQAGYDVTSAQLLLEEQGWKIGKNGIRYKDGKPLSFSLYAQDNNEYANVARALQKQWRAIGVDVRISLQDSTDFQISLASHDYDALLYGISIGKDPDVYVYWDSKNADVRSESRLNFSEYKSAIADSALQAGRTRSDASLRAVKYQPFLQAWRDDAPAVGLYQPSFLYIAHDKIYGLTEHPTNAQVERLTNVHNWMIREESVPQVK